MKILQLNFIPRNADLALLVLRVWLGASMLWLHGWMKVTKFSTIAPKFMDFLGLGQTPSLVLAIFAELICAALLVVGLWTRLAALCLGFTMGVAFWVAHGGKLSGAGSGEMAFLYLAGCVALFVAGGGKFSVDARLGAKG
jgi:putative oxidoreductase